MKDSKLTLDFDKKSLVIPDDQIKQLPMVGKPVEIDPSDTKLDERQKQKLHYLFNSFKGLFSDQPGRMIRWALKLSEFNMEWEHRPGAQNVVADVLSRNPVDNVEGSQISCVALRALALNSREQLIQEQREDPELGHIYRYLENPDNGVQLMQLADDSLFCVEENHDNWDRFLHEFSFALRTAVNETAGKTPAELFLGRKIITPFRELVLVTDGAEYVGGNIEKLFDEASQNVQRQHKTWEKYYNRKRGERSNSGKSRRFRKPSGKSNKGTAGLEDLRFKRNKPVMSTETSERNSFNKHPSQGLETFPGTSNQQQMRRFSPPKEESRRGARVQSDRARETRTTGSKGHSAAEGRPMRSGKTTTVRPFPYYLRTSRITSGGSSYQRSTGIDSLPQNSLRRRSLSMEALDGAPADRSI
ncbi:uncharacterized protein TNCV_2351321 [Trichonephila clavipes]|nr:uncharacterized protein TNCV_2351321 [Trichonephila clavipes]